MTRRCIPKAYITLAAMVVFALAVTASAERSDANIFKAMQDELDRSMSELVMADLERPYFIAYTVDDFDELTIAGALGELTESTQEQTRYITVDVRVGDTTLDNSNFVGGYYNPPPDFQTIALDNDYDALRNRMYLLTDRAYKNALKNLSRKKAYLQTRIMKNRPNDFIMPAPNEFIDNTETADFDIKTLEDMIRAATEAFREYPMVIASELECNAAVANQYYVNSNNSKAMRGDRVYTFKLTMQGKTAEGEDVFGTDRMIVNRKDDIPDKNELTTWVRGNADRMKAMIEAETIDEYAGPVILTGDAAGEFFRQLFVKNVSNNPSPLYEIDQVAERYPTPEFGNKVKRRVLPAFIDVYDDPTMAAFDNTPLMGFYEVDDAGTRPQRVHLVEQGKLVNLLIGEAPTKKVNTPNGHARGAVSKQLGARPGNMVFESSDKTTFDQLKQTMLELCQDVDLEYGLVIRKLDDLNASRQRQQVYFYGGSGGNESALTPPLEVYKVYADGHEVPVRNLEFSNVTVRMLRDILQTGDQQYVYNYLIGDDFEMPASLVCPAVLIEEMELKKSEAKVMKPPIVPSPLADK
ncbi:MAG: hypothetical protein JW763_08755 [candidate division Zixibacteria bacterium]|nr:hypothetical protein [candidate division Zixibacteria bacterium]